MSSRSRPRSSRRSSPPAVPLARPTITSCRPARAGGPRFVSGPPSDCSAEGVRRGASDRSVLTLRLAQRRLHDRVQGQWRSIRPDAKGADRRHRSFRHLRIPWHATAIGSVASATFDERRQTLVGGRLLTARTLFQPIGPACLSAVSAALAAQEEAADPC